MEEAGTVGGRRLATLPAVVVKRERDIERGERERGRGSDSWRAWRRENAGEREINKGEGTKRPIAGVLQVFMVVRLITTLVAPAPARTRTHPFPRFLTSNLDDPKNPTTSPHTNTNREQEEERRQRGPPPASRTALKNIPEVRVSV